MIRVGALLCILCPATAFLPFSRSRPASATLSRSYYQLKAPARTSTSTFNHHPVVTGAVSLRAVSFVSPLLESGYPPAVLEAEQCRDLGITNPKPLLLYLPGFDGTLVAPFLQFPELGSIFEVRGMQVPMDDRSTFQQLRDAVIEHLASEGPDRPVYLMGESFGGLLTLEVALEIQSSAGASGSTSSRAPNLCGIVLVNPATSYLRSNLAELGPKVAALPDWQYPVGVVSLLPLFVDDYGLSQLLLILSSEALPSVIDTPAREAYMGRTAFSLPNKLKFMPKDTLRWRLEQWLTVGNTRINGRENEMKGLLSTLPVLVLAGEDDRTLPAVDEAQRLHTILPDCSVHTVDGAGHAGTCGSRVDIAALMRNRFPLLRREIDNATGEVISSSFPDGFEIAEDDSGRISMKEEAASGEGKFFGLTARYDGSVGLGLSPLKYWNQELFRRWVS